MASIGALFLLLSLLSQADAHLRVRGLQEDRVPKGVFRNPCTGSWSNDAEVLNIDDCDAYLKDQGLTGSNSGLGGGSDGNGDRDGASNYDCSIKGNDDPTSPTVLRRVEYWYCVENSQNETTWLPKLEEKIYNVAVDRMTWCIGYPVQRDLREEERVSRHLGVLGVLSQPSDKLRSDVKYPEECFVVQGGLTIKARESDDLNKTIESMLDEVADAMTNDKLLGEDIPNVTKVTYLGTSQEDVENAGREQGIVGAGVTSGEDSIDGDNTVLIVGICASVLLLALLLLLVYRRKRNSNFLALADDGKGFKPLPGTGDPPGSFHHGVYHYFRDGQSYLSTNCYECHETRMLSNSDYGRVVTAPIEESASTDAYYDKLIRANSKDIGNGHSGMNVHRCASSTCHLCSPNRKAVTMVKIARNNSRNDSKVYHDNVGVAHSTYDL